MLFIYSSIIGHWGCFHLLATVKNDAIHVGVQISIQVSASYYLGIYLEVELLGHRMAILFLFFEESSHYFQQWLHYFIPPTLEGMCSDCSTDLPTLFIFFFK